MLCDRPTEAFIQHSHVMSDLEVGDTAVTRSGHVVQLLADGAWRVECEGIRRVSGCIGGHRVSGRDLFAKLGGLERRGDEIPMGAGRNVLPCQSVREDEFIAGQAVSFPASDGTIAAAQYLRAAGPEAVGKLQVWGRVCVVLSFVEARARMFFSEVNFARDRVLIAGGRH